MPSAFQPRKPRLDEPVEHLTACRSQSAQDAIAAPSFISTQEAGAPNITHETDIYNAFERIFDEFKLKVIQEHLRQIRAISTELVVEASTMMLTTTSENGRPTSTQPLLSNFIREWSRESYKCSSGRFSMLPDVSTLLFRSLSPERIRVAASKEDDDAEQQRTEEENTQATRKELDAILHWHTMVSRAVSPSYRLQRFLRCFLVSQSQYQMRQEFADVEKKSKSRIRSYRRRRESLGMLSGQAPWSRTLKDKMGRIVLHPHGNGRMTWISLSMFLILFDVLTIPLSWSFSMGDSFYVASITWFGCIFWTLDIHMSFMTAYFVNGGLEIQPLRIAVHYVKTWFVFDALMVMIDWMVLPTSTSKSKNKVLQALWSLRMMRAIRLYRVHVNVTDKLMLRANSKRSVFYVSFAKMFILGSISLHLLACLWHGIGIAYGDGWARRRPPSSGDSGDEVPKVAAWYSTSALWAMSQFHGTTYVEPSNTLERMVSVMTLFIGSVFFAWFVGIATFGVFHLTNLYTAEMLLVCDRFMKDKCISAQTARRARKYVMSHQNMIGRADQVEKQSKLLSLLPTSLRMDVLLEARRPLLKSMLFFEELFDDCARVARRICAEGTALDSYHQHDIVFWAGDPCHRLFVLEAGMLHYDISENRIPEAYFASGGDAIDGSNVLAAMYFAARRSISEPPNTPDTGPSATGARNPVAASYGTQHVRPGQCVAEGGLWVKWTHLGELQALQHCTNLYIDLEVVLPMLLVRVDLAVIATIWAKRFVLQLNMDPRHQSDLFQYSDHLAYICESDVQDEDNIIDGEDSHFIFLSHFKAEAGTEATLMQEHLHQMINDGDEDLVSRMGSPVFLDSEDLIDLRGLTQHVINTTNFIFILTPGVLARPWCLIELVTAFRHNLRIVPVLIHRPGLEFSFPDESFYKNLLGGDILTGEAVEILRAEGVELAEVETALRQVFMQIALPFSPHKSQNVRQAELEDILKRCVRGRFDSRPLPVNKKANGLSLVALGTQSSADTTTSKKSTATSSNGLNMPLAS